MDVLIGMTLFTVACIVAFAFCEWLIKQTQFPYFIAASLCLLVLGLCLYYKLLDIPFGWLTVALLPGLIFYVGLKSSGQLFLKLHPDTNPSLFNTQKALWNALFWPLSAPFIIVTTVLVPLKNKLVN